MIREDVGEYFNAKQQAAENLLGMRATEVTLPSNREIRAAILQLTSFKGVSRDRRLAHMRRVALDLMERLAAFDPRLIGSVASGAIHAHSDIDLHVFCRSHDQLDHVLRVEGFDAERIERDVAAEGRCQSVRALPVRTRRRAGGAVGLRARGAAGREPQQHRWQAHRPADEGAGRAAAALRRGGSGGHPSMPAASPWFARAHGLLQKDAWFVEHEPERLARMP